MTVITTDYYLQVEAAVRTHLLTLTNFFEHDFQVSSGDESILGDGANYFAVCKKGQYAKNNLSAQDAQYLWNIQIDFYARFESENITTANLNALVSAANNLLDGANETSLGNTPGVVSLVFGTADLPQYVMSEGNPNAGPVFKVQKCNLLVEQINGQQL